MAKRPILSILAGPLLAGLVFSASPMPAMADVRDGVEAWSRGEWDAAVAQWRAPAEAGDPDAQFNMGQAYRLGQGVPRDLAQAEALYLRAAQAGHLRAADTYGLLLFQDGRREQALPYVKAAADRGDPRAQYLMGIAHFNGDLADRDWVRAYALLTLANGQGLPQAKAALADMDQHIPLEQRQQAASLAVELQQQADTTRAREMAAADLAMDGRPPSPAVSSSAAPPPVSPPVPPPVPPVAGSPAQDAVQQAMQASGTEDPRHAGADYARPASVAQANVAQASTPPPTPAPTPAPARPQPQPQPQSQPQPRPEPVQQAQATGAWKVQLGAFSVRANAERLWASLRNRPELAGRVQLMVPAGRLTKLQAGGYATRADAQAACTALQKSGQPCLVTQ